VRHEPEYESLRLLEGRRLSYDAAMWQAPTLTVLSQTFLLVILSDPSVRFGVALPIAMAGWITLFVVAIALWQLRDREEQFSKRINELAEPLGVVRPTRERVERNGFVERWLDWEAWKMWRGVFIGFAVADLDALVWTHSRT
jgi:hypothetical protein